MSMAEHFMKCAGSMSLPGSLQFECHSYDNSNNIYYFIYYYYIISLYCYFIITYYYVYQKRDLLLLHQTNPLIPSTDGGDKPWY